MSAIVLLLTNTYTSLELILFSMLMLLLPCSQSAIQLVNYLVTSLLEPKILPKLDFSEAFPTTAPRWWPFPACCSTRNRFAAWWRTWKYDSWAITIPTFISRCSPTCRILREPASEDDPLIEYCAQLVRELNEKVCQPGFGIVFSLPSPPGLQPARTSVDGLGAQARQADGPEQAAAQRTRQLPGENWRSVHPAADSFRDHAGRGHGIAARIGRSHDWSDGPSA